MINEVRNTVLSILNKNNYGYISPSDFNLFAEQAQMELFEEMFKSYNKMIGGENARTQYEGYADEKKALEEAMEIFNITKPLSNYIGNVYYLPSLTTTLDDYYLINTIQCYPNRYTFGTNTTTVSAQLVDSGASFNTLGIVAGDVVVNATTNAVAQVVQVVSATTILINNDIFTIVGETYVIYKASTATIADKITQDKLLLLNTSLLTSSSTLFPTYSQQGLFLTVMPPSYNFVGQVIANYFRYPAVPKWTYVTLVGGEPAFDQSQLDYQDFELPVEYIYPLTTKILQYSGVSIRESEVVQYGILQEQQQSQ